MKRLFLICAALITGFAVLVSCKQEDPRVRSEGPEVVSFRALPFELKDVELLEGHFRDATELNIQSLLNYEPDRFLAPFRTDAGLEPRGERYGGWEAMSLVGHSLGHYLSACALMYQTTGDEEFLRRVNYIVDELALCQEADGDGYIGGFTRVGIDDMDITTLQDEDVVSGKYVFEEEIANGIIVSASFSLNGIWAPFYTQHKIMAGLRDAYLLAGNEKALEVNSSFADWLYGVMAHLPYEDVQEILVCEYGGINETLADLYGMTGDERYLELSRIFHDEEVLSPLERGEDMLQGYHANTQIPKVTGMARRYELTGDAADRDAAEFFWRTVTDNHTYVTGGNANEEYFGEPGKLRDRLGPNTTETCNVYNMLRLTEHIFQWDASEEAAAYYERALLNHIRASQHPVDGRVIYNLNIDMGGHKSFQDPFGFTCCVGSGMENHSKYGTAIYFHNDQELFVNQFIASELTWSARGVVLRQETRFPEDDMTRFKFQLEEPSVFTLQLRYPHWAIGGFEVFLNGEAYTVNQKPGSYVSIDRVWATGDELEVRFPFELRMESMPDDSDRIAIFNGPVLLAGDLGPEDDPGISDPHYVPVMMTTDRDPSNWTESLGSLHRYTTTAGRPRDVNLQPFYSIYDRRYSIFWDLMTENRWENHLASLALKQEALTRLNELSHDHIDPSDSELEERKNLSAHDSHVRYYKLRHGREANRGGWFAYEIEIPSDGDVSLIIDYWGGFEGDRTFDIVVDGEVVATQNGSDIKAGHFISIPYDIPSDITSGKQQVSIEFMPHDFNRAGPVFGIRTIGTGYLDEVDYILMNKPLIILYQNIRTFHEKDYS